MLAGQPHRLDHLGQQLTRPAHERFALQVLIFARGLADEHQFRLGIAHAKNHAVSPRRQVRTLHADRRPLRQMAQLL